MAIDIRRAKAIPSPYMSDGELRWLASQAAQATTVIEIGCANGRSTRALGDHCQGMVYAVDSWANAQGPERFEQFQRNLSDLIAAGRVWPVRLSSLAAAGASDVLADLVFIDACHSYEAVLSDIRAWSPHVRPGGVLSGHDYWPTSQPGVKRAVDECFAGRFTRHADSIWAVRL